MKQEIINLRKEIAALEAEQRNAKEQRKTVNFHGERTMEPYEAYCAVLNNKDKLRVRYAAYGLLRGRKFSEIENHWDKEEYNGAHPLARVYSSAINTILEEYGYTMTNYEEKKNWYGKTYKDYKDNCDEKIVRIGE